MEVWEQLQCGICLTVEIELYGMIDGGKRSMTARKDVGRRQDRNRE